MQFTNAIIILAALTGFTTAAPVAEVDERSSGTALTFFSVNGTATGMTAPKGWAPIKPSSSMMVDKVTISSLLSTCAMVTAKGNYLVEATLFEPRTFTISPAQAINTIACASLDVGLSSLFG